MGADRLLQNWLPPWRWEKKKSWGALFGSHAACGGLVFPDNERGAAGWGLLCGSSSSRNTEISGGASIPRRTLSPVRRTTVSRIESPTRIRSPSFLESTSIVFPSVFVSCGEYAYTIRRWRKVNYFFRTIAIAAVKTTAGATCFFLIQLPSVYWPSTWHKSLRSARAKTRRRKNWKTDCRRCHCCRKHSHPSVPPRLAGSAVDGWCRRPPRGPQGRSAGCGASTNQLKQRSHAAANSATGAWTSCTFRKRCPSEP